VIPARGPVIGAEGILEKALTFDLAVGIYVLTLAALAPLAGFSRRGGALWRGAVLGTTLYAYGIETVQTLRGFDPRFTRVGSAVDEYLGTSLGVGALFMIVIFVIFAARLFRLGVLAERPLLALGARYGAAGVVLGGFAAGFWMGAVEGRHVGESGSLLPLHALGFHGLQAVPIVAWLLERSRVPPERARLRVHLAGFAWLAAIAAVATQTVQGRTVQALEPATLAALAFLVAWTGLAVGALAVARRGARTTAAAGKPAVHHK